MQFYTHQMYHIYNEGNNKQEIFLSPDNYLYFLWKMRAYLLPFGQLISWCLLPNCFHWQFYVLRLEVVRKEFRKHIDEVEFQRRTFKYGSKAQQVKRSHTRTAHPNSMIKLNDAIGDLQKGYTRAINIQLKRTGSLFREECKAQEYVLDEFRNLIAFHEIEKYNLDHMCMKLIHQFPQRLNLVSDFEQYEWSSAMEYNGQRHGTLCNLQIGRIIQDL